MKRKILAAMLSAFMVVGSIPGTTITAIAAENEETAVSEENSAGDEAAVNEEPSAGEENSVSKEVSAGEETSATDSAVVKSMEAGIAQEAAADQSVAAAAAQEIESVLTNADEEEAEDDEDDISVSVLSDSAPSFADQAVEYTDGSDCTATLIPDQAVYFKYTPESDGVYLVTMSNPAVSWGGVEVSLYEDDSYFYDYKSVTMGSVYTYRVNMTTGHTYYFAMQSYVMDMEFASSDSYEVTFSAIKSQLSASAVNGTSFTTDFGESVTLEASGTTERDAEVTYAWYLSGSQISGASGSTYTIPAKSYTSDSLSLECRVSDGTETLSVYYTVSVTGTLTAEAAGEAEQSVSYDQDCTLAVTASSSNEISYQWYYAKKYSEWEDGEEVTEYSILDGETGSSLTLPAKSYTKSNLHYKCEVKDGSFTRNVEFSVSVSSLTAEIAAVSAAEGQTVTLHCDAQSSYGSSLTYDWEAYKPTGGYDKLGESSDYSFTVSTDTAVLTYFCYVSDGFETKMVEAPITYTGFSEYKLSGSFDSYEGNTGEQITLCPNLSAVGSDGEGTDVSALNLNFTWYHNEEDEDGNWGYYPIDGAEDSSLVITLEKGGALYRLKVSGTDADGKTLLPLTLTTYVYNYQNEGYWVTGYIENQAQKWGDTFEYAITEISGLGEGTLDEASIQWYKAVSGKGTDNLIYKKIDGATGPSYSEVAGPDSGFEYKCECKLDGWIFSQSFTNPASALSVESTELTRGMKYGTSGTFRVNAYSMEDGAVLTYQWYSYDSVSGEWEAIDGATSSVYKVPVEDQTEVEVQYQCVVSDGSNDITVNATAYIYDIPSTEIKIKITPAEELVYGQDVKLKAVINADMDTSGFTYDWTIGENSLSGQNGAEVTVPMSMINLNEFGYTLVNCTAYPEDRSEYYYSDNYYLSFPETLTVNCDQNTFNAAYGSSVVLKANAVTTTGNEITYQWQKYDEDNWDFTDIDGANAAEYTLDTSSLTQEWSQCRCVISDGAFTQTLDYWIRLTLLKTTNSAILTDSGNTITLTAELADGCSGTFAWQWAEYNEETGEYEDILKANSKSVKLSCGSAGETQKLSCTVTAGSYSQIEYFEVATKNTLAVSAHGYVTTADKKTTIAVSAATTTGKTISYQWQEEKTNEDGETVWTDLTGETGSSLAVDFSESDSCSLNYCCMVSDGTNQVAKTIQVLYQPITLSDEEQNYTTLYDQPVTLKAEAEATADDLTLSYQWLEMNASGEFEELTGQTSDTLTTDSSLYYAGSDRTYNFMCRVSCGVYNACLYANVNPVSFKVEENTYVTLPYGADTTLTVNVEAPEGTQLSYLWTKHENSYSQMIDLGNDTSSLKISGTDMKIGEMDSYVCEVSNGKVTKTCAFDVSCISPISCVYDASGEYTPINYLSTITCYADAGSSITLKCQAEDAEGKDLTWQWYTVEPGSGSDDESYGESDADDDNPNGDIRTIIVGAASDTYTITTDENAGYMYFGCSVSNGSYTGFINYRIILLDAKEIESDTVYTQSAQSTSSNVDQIYSFTAPDSGSWYLTSFDAEDIEGVNHVVTKTEDGYAEFDYMHRSNLTGFQEVVDLKKGQTVYFILPESSKEFSFIVSQSGQSWQKEVDNVTIYAPLGEEAVLTLPDYLILDGNTYQWYASFITSEDEWGYSTSSKYLLNGETGSSCSIRAEEEGYTTAYVTCRVKKADGSTCEYFYEVVFTSITFTDGLNNERTISEKPGETVDLSINAVSTTGNKVTGKWYQQKMDGHSYYRSILIASGDTCQVSAPADGDFDRYYCILDDGCTTEQVTIIVKGDKDAVHTINLVGAEVKFTDATGDAGSSGTGSSDTGASGTDSVPSYIYTGSAIVPEVTVTVAGKTLIQGTDYTVSCTNNTEPGKSAKLTVTGAGKYVGTVSKTFTIKPSQAALSGVTYTNAGVTLTWTGKLQDGCSWRVLRKNAGTNSAAGAGWNTIADLTAADFTSLKTAADGGYIYTYADAKTTADSGKAFTYTVLQIAADGTESDYNTTGLTITWIAAPSGLKAANTVSAVKVTWTASAGAAAYRVFRKTASTGWKKLADTTAASYTDTTAAAGTTYYYTVRCINAGGTAYTSGFNSSGVKIIRLTQPAPTLANTTTGVNIKWAKVSGATAYYVYRKTTGSWSRIATVSAAGSTSTTFSYTDTKAASGTTYYYTVRAAGGGFLSTFVTDKKITYLKNPTVKASKTSYGIILSWTKITGATSYYVYRRTAGGSWTRVGISSSNGYLDTTAKTGVTYYYTARAYKGGYLSSFTSSNAVKR